MMEQQQGWSKLDRALMVLVLLIFFLGGVTSVVAPDLFKPKPPPPPELVRLTPVPRIPMQISSPGTGTYVSATFNVTVTDVPAGQDAVVITIGDTNLLNSIGQVLNPSAGTVIVACDVGAASGPITIYAQAYDPDYTVYASNNPLSLNVGEEPPDPVTNWPYTYSAAWSAPSPTGGPCIAPCRATIGGTTYIVLAEQGGMFHLYDPSADTWAEADYGAALFASGQYDPTQGAGLFDAGDGTHVWANSGSWYEATGGVSYMTWRKFAVTPGSGASLVSSVRIRCSEPDVTNAIQVATGQVQFVVRRDGFITELYDYECGAGSAVRAFIQLSRGPVAGVVTQETPTRLDTHLYHASDGTTYWFHHNESGVYNFVDVYVLTGERFVYADRFYIASTDCYQTWGYYSDVSRYVGDIGSGGTASAQVDPAGAFWTPAGGGATRAPFPIGRVTRRWYLDGSPLLVVGWAADDADALKPFVMNIEPYALQATAASSFAAGRQAAGARTTSYAVDEGVVSHVSAAAVTSFAAGQQATAEAASSHAAGLAVTGEAETSFAADLARPSTTPHPVQVNVSMVRGRVIG